MKLSEKRAIYPRNEMSRWLTFSHTNKKESMVVLRRLLFKARSELMATLGRKKSDTLNSPSGEVCSKSPIDNLDPEETFLNIY